jgi:hypothetical protein
VKKLLFAFLACVLGSGGQAAFADVPPPALFCLKLTLVQPPQPDFVQERCVLDGERGGLNVSASITVRPGQYVYVDSVTYQVLGNPPQTLLGPTGAYGTGNGNLLAVPPQPGRGKVVALIDGQELIVACYFIDIYNPPGWQLYPIHACHS